MICEKCGKEIKSVLVNVFLKDGSDSFTTVPIIEAKESAVIIETNPTWTGYDLSEEERIETISCPHCKEFPFTENLIETQEVTRIVCFKKEAAVETDKHKVEPNLLNYVKAVRHDTREWISGNLLIDHCSGTHYIIVDDDIAEHTVGSLGYVVDPETICRYTGLKDRNDELIFENDEVEILGEPDDEKFIITWGQDTARFEMVGDSCTVDFDNYWSHEVEVVGNKILGWYA